MRPPSGSKQSDPHATGNRSTIMISSTRLFLLLFVLLGPSAQAEIYKWVDADGETHYSERKPGVEIEVQTITPYTSATNAERETWQEREEASVEQRKAANEQAEKDSIAAADAAAMQRNCEQARIRVASLERPRVNKVSDDGQRTRMPEEWRQSELAEARAAVKKYCQ